MFWLVSPKLINYAAALMLYSFSSASLATSSGHQEVFFFSKSSHHCCLLLCTKQEPWSLTHLRCREWWLKNFKNTVQPTSRFTTLLESKWELKALQTAWLGWWVTPLGLEMCMCWCVLSHIVSFPLRVVWTMQRCSSWFVYPFVQQRAWFDCLLQSTLSLAKLGWQQRRVERKLGCEQSPFPFTSTGTWKLMDHVVH